MVIAAFGGAIFQVTSIWLEYFRYDVVVSKTFKYQRQAVFPAVTFCNMNPVKRSIVERQPATICGDVTIKEKKEAKEARYLSC
jgi:hypothetical protein